MKRCSIIKSFMLTSMTATVLLSSACSNLEGLISSLPTDYAEAKNEDGSSVRAQKITKDTHVVIKKDSSGKVVDMKVHGLEKDRASASSTDPETGNTTTVTDNGDGTRTIIVTDRNGKVISKKIAGKEKDSASSYDPETGNTKTAVDNGDGTRTVIETDKSGNIIEKKKHTC